MERSTIALATKLLVKAQATCFEPEAAALAARAYRLLAAELNAYDDKAARAGVARKRERRQLRDRRSAAGPSAPSAPCGRTDATTSNDWFDSNPRRRVDLRM